VEAEGGSLAGAGSREGGAAARLSACVIARDEADRIEACLRSLAFCDEILVVDAHSSDATRERAAACGARVIERDWPGHVAQKEFAIRQARHHWVLCVDADERVSPELRGAIEALRAAGFPGRAGWRMPRLSRYLGRWIRHGTWYPDLQLRLFDRRRGRWAGRDPHDRVELDGPVGRLEGELLHEPYRSFDEHLATIDRYTTLMAEQLFASGRRARLSDLVLRPPWRFLRFYLLERGFLEGWRGLLLSYLAAHYARLKYAKLWLLARRDEAAGAPETR
jgi:glycosyltransferase involved in cell wall biosynthesis